MTREDFFQNILAPRLSAIDTTLASKAKEYASEGDRLHNFKLAARVSGSNTKKALWGMVMKHLVSVIDIIESPLPTTQSHADEKIGDLINYLILLEAILEDERNGK